MIRSCWCGILFWTFRFSRFPPKIFYDIDHGSCCCSQRKCQMSSLRQN